jgi:membrane-associated phospholipid phosphatase
MTVPNAYLALVGASLVEGSRRAARRAPVHPVEEAIFRRANGAGDGLRLPVRTVMQAGTFATVPAVAVLVAARGAPRLAVQVAVGGTAAWLLAKASKPLAGRPRPGRILEGVRTREKIAGDLGWLSGHAAVSTTLAATLSPAVRPRVRLVLGSIVATTAFGRIYVGAHLPLDVVGGIGLGMLIAAGGRTIAAAIDHDGS